jgi:hypothetical protein
MKSTEMEIEQFFIMICYFYADHLQTVKICDMEIKKNSLIHNSFGEIQMMFQIKWTGSNICTLEVY